MTGQRSIDEVLLPQVCLFCDTVGDKYIFIDDNAPCHRIFAVQDCLQSEDIQLLVCRARSPYLNPIENVLEFFWKSPLLVENIPQQTRSSSSVH
ncbi:hypothetical protein AVEN_178346-1 [Araneus ventricosus]|uniref:Tc1-like transposase DDE domain-containing protein n=1 Tax=Araneus ventricosus TaxID=182803 RepID=A0A4Y2BEG3_ARAVE|nr:hypothetical protein AVEN_178346-1 [Araneus ventricosus]